MHKMLCGNFFDYYFREFHTSDWVNLFCGGVSLLSLHFCLRQHLPVLFMLPLNSLCGPGWPFMTSCSHIVFVPTSDRVSSAHIHIPEALYTRGAQDKVCTSHSDVLKGSPNSFGCHELEGSIHILLVSKASTYLR